MQFGDYVENYIEDIDWLWKYQGRLLVISTPYHEGVHIATRPNHFLPIIDHLEQLHSQGFVHGDIRAYNMVLQYDTTKPEKPDKGWLIDFDYGGVHNMVVYPKGYKYSLDDGDRPGREEMKITIMDDWKSLFGLILHFYSFVDKEGVVLTDKDDYFIVKQRRKVKSYFNERVASDDVLLLSDFERPAGLLREYIKCVSHVYDVEPTQKFELDFKKCGFWPMTRQSLDASQAGTGSPPKVKS